MIKIALKHWIYDYCIDLVFKEIKSNFFINCLNMKNIKIGDRFGVIEKDITITNKSFDLNAGVYKRLFFDCIIKNVRITKTGLEIIFYYEHLNLYDKDYNILHQYTNWTHRCFINEISRIQK
jgi:hypothetical protein